MRSSTAMANASLPPSVNCCQDLFLLTVQTSLLIYASDLSISVFVLSMSSKFEKEPTNSVGVYCHAYSAFCFFCLVMSNVMLVTTMNVANPLCNLWHCVMICVWNLDQTIIKLGNQMSHSPSLFFALFSSKWKPFLNKYNIFLIHTADCTADLQLLNGV